MCKEFLTLHIGQAGVQSSHALWELVCIEHGIGSDGTLRNQAIDSYTGENIEAMYYEIKNLRFVPRAILIDLEPTVVDEVRKGSYRDMWNPSNIINQKEDAASNYARGYYTSGKSFSTVVVDRINRELERCENLAAFEIVHSFAGGTGSGFTALIYELINELFGKKFRFSLGVFPSPTLTEIMVESYNAVLHASSTLANEDCVVVFDNESLFKKSLDKLYVTQPTFSLMNRLLSQMFSSISLSHRYRFFGSQHSDVTELLTNLVPYPRIHFPIMSYSPLMSFIQQGHEQFNCSRLTNDVFHDDAHVMQCSLQDNKFMSCCMLYRGTVSPKPIIDAIAKIKRSRNINFVDWCPTGFKIGINTCPPIQIPHCEQAIGDNALCMISGNTAISKCWSMLLTKFDMLMSKRAFVHWYVAEGLEEGEFLDSRDNLQSLILDYEELASQDVDDRSTDEVKPINNVPNVGIPIDTNNTAASSRVDRIFESQLNQSYIPDDLYYLDTINESLATKKLHSNKTAKSERKYYKNPSASKGCTNGIPNINEKKSSLNTESRRAREKTKDLDVKSISQTVSKCLAYGENYPNARFIHPKQGNLSLTVNKTTRNCNINPLQSLTSSKYDVLEKYELMRNNNKGRSLHNSSSTGSFKSAIETQNKTSSNFIRKSSSQLRVIEKSLYSSRSQKELNLRTKVETKVDKTFPAVKRPASINLLPREEKIICLINKPVNESAKSVDIDTRMSQNFKHRHLNFSKQDSVTCEPIIHFRQSDFCGKMDVS